MEEDQEYSLKSSDEHCDQHRWKVRGRIDWHEWNTGDFFVRVRLPMMVLIRETRKEQWTFCGRLSIVEQNLIMTSRIGNLLINPLDTVKKSTDEREWASLSAGCSSKRACCLRQLRKWSTLTCNPMRTDHVPFCNWIATFFFNSPEVIRRQMNNGKDIIHSQKGLNIVNLLGCHQIDNLLCTMRANQIVKIRWTDWENWRRKVEHWHFYVRD